MNGLRKCGKYTIEFYTAIRKNETMWFESKWMKLGDNMLSEISQVERKRPHVFYNMWKIEPKDKCIYKNRHDHVYIYV
jgi:hypothetical protein